MKNILGFITIILIITSFTACEKIILGEEEANNPVNNFELLWKDFKEHYALFGVRGLDWDSIYVSNKPLVNNNTNDEELWDIFTNMIGYLDDSHTYIARPLEGIYFVSGSENDERIIKEFSHDLLLEKYIENEQTINDYPTKFYLDGKVKNKNIGYICLGGIDFTKKEIDKALENINEFPALIIDLRHNSGGDDFVAADFTNRFADEEKISHTVEEKNGPEPNDFAEQKIYKTQPSDRTRYDKPIVILTDEFTVSAAEIFLLYTKQIDDITQIGTYTSGDFSDISMNRFLPNGWEYQMSIMKFLTPEGKSLDGIGHKPDVFIKNEISDIENNTDKVLERAIDYIFETYGIE